MSNRTASSPASSSGRGASDSSVEPYRLYTGRPLLRSRDSAATAIMSWASPRRPCSGPNRARRSKPAARRRSIEWRSSTSTDVGLAMSPSFFPFRDGPSPASRRSSPVATRTGKAYQEEQPRDPAAAAGGRAAAAEPAGGAGLRIARIVDVERVDRRARAAQRERLRQGRADRNGVELA